MGILRVKVNGQWVDIGTGGDEVFVGPNDPGANSGLDLWYDTDAASLLPQQIFPLRNLLDNGQHMINQRQVGNIVVGSGTFLADRWACWDSGVGQAYLYYSTYGAFGVPFPAGRPHPGYIQSIQMNTAEAGASLSPADWIYYRQGIEGQNLQHLNWGTPDAKPLTLSFDVYSPVPTTTTFVVELERNETVARSISKLLTVPSGISTQVLTFPGDTVTQITNDSTGRLAVNFWIAAGSSWTSSPLNTVWNNRVDVARASGISNAWQALVGAPLAFTNIQLEVGSIATPFEVRRFDDELTRCMRYYEKSYAYNVIPGSNAGYQGSASCMLFDSAVPTRMRMTGVDFRVTKRATPTLQTGWTTDGTVGYINAYNAPASKFQVATYGTISDRHWACDYMTLITAAAVGQYYHFHWAAGAEI